MPKRLLAIVVIFCCASVAWLILGATLNQRTSDSDSTQQAQLGSQWGSTLTQSAPNITGSDGTHNGTVAIPIRRSSVTVTLTLEQRRKGLLWYNLYDVTFFAHYVIQNTSESPHLKVDVPLPSSGGSYANLVYRIGGHQVDTASALDNHVTFDLARGRSTTVDIGYTSRGMESWTYQFKKGVASVDNFTLDMNTNFRAIDFPPRTLLPTSETPTNDGYRLQWSYANVVTGDGIGMSIPYPLQPGPLAQRITLWAPVALLFYLFVMLLITTLRNIELHPINYFFLAAAFFAFHLLFAYLVDRIPLEVAFAICSIVSMFLTISYLRLVVGWRFAAVESAAAQFIYLVLFSFALFNEGWSGLTITIGAIVTLFVSMQATGGIRWSERFGLDNA